MERERERERGRGWKATDRHRRRVACAASKMQLYAPAIDELVPFQPIDRNLRSPSPRLDPAARPRWEVKRPSIS